MLLDLPAGVNAGKVRPYIALYEAMDIINWDDGTRNNPIRQTLNLVVLEETEAVRFDGFDWQDVEKYRVLMLGELNENESTGLYTIEIWNQGTEATIAVEVITPNLGGKTLDEIPFVFVNSKDMLPMPDDPPLLGLANLSLAIYRGEADHRQALFMQAQDTLVVQGGEEDKNYRVGAGATLVVPVEGKAYFIGVGSTGLSEMRHTLEDDKKIAALKAAQLIDTTSRQRESGDALRIRVAAQTATLVQIAEAGAAALEELLKKAARWMGANEEEVSVIPNKDFQADEMEPQGLVHMMTAKAMGLPLSLQSMHDRMKERGLTELTFDQEVELIEEEPELGTGTEAGGEPEGEEGEPGANQ